ncbi:hypothetical protein EP10_002680 [Geobacillus icigianus]|uniref:Uncharacterized protein n=1 Tax=Geobacillus icigianus TaxID=1430331 RepID=A0ABU6BIW3_9BACL|nr:hypothetical protein [Geobacillus icigianus]
MLPFSWVFFVWLNGCCVTVRRMFGLRNGRELAYDEGKMTYHRVGDQAIGE